MSERGHPNGDPVRNTGDLVDINVFLANGTWEQCRTIKLKGFFPRSASDQKNRTLDAWIGNGNVSGGGNSQLSITLYRIPYGEMPKESEPIRDTYRFQLLLLIRFLGEYLSSGTRPGTIPENVPEDIFIRRALDLFDSPDELNEQLQNFSMQNEESYNQVKKLFDLVRIDQEYQFNLDEKLRNRNLLDILKETTVTPVSSADEESKLDVVTANYEKMDELLAIGAYVASLPAVRSPIKNPSQLTSPAPLSAPSSRRPSFWRRESQSNTEGYNNRRTSELSQPPDKRSRSRSRFPMSWFHRSRSADNRQPKENQYQEVPKRRGTVGRKSR